jgi:hypothetical protein
MVVLSTSILLLNNSKIIDNIKNFNDNQRFLQNNVYIMFYLTLLLMVTALPAVLVSMECNKKNKVMYGLLAFLFSDIYLLQWSIKKFILNKSNYCK